jgi:uncharacterized phage-associated protein
MTKDDILKLKAVLLYILNKTGGLDYYRIFKIMYFADTEHLAKYGRKIIPDTFYALKFGPVPTNLFDMIKGIKKSDETSTGYLELNDSISFADDDAENVLLAKENYDPDELSQSDIEILDKSIKENSKSSFYHLCNKSHGVAWEKAKNGDHKIDILEMAKEGGAQKGMIDYIRNMNLIANALS